MIGRRVQGCFEGLALSGHIRGDDRSSAVGAAIDSFLRAGRGADAFGCAAFAVLGDFWAAAFSTAADVR
ncbi:MAG TPA: hypothetical protein VN150_16025 [Ochrobactrum sp.]|nr:hypothetical protein [Ochrobactrum sp.]